MCDKQCPVKDYKDRLIAEKQEEINNLQKEVKGLRELIYDYQDLIDKMMTDSEEGEEQ
jgi:uncharacterized protein YlxW (UPF0749 family)